MSQLPFPISHSIYMKFRNLKLGGRSFEASVTLRQQQTVQHYCVGSHLWQGGTQRSLWPGSSMHLLRMCQGLSWQQACRDWGFKSMEEVQK